MQTSGPPSFGLIFSYAQNNAISYQWGYQPYYGLFTNPMVFNTNEWTFVALVVGTNLTAADVAAGITADTNATLYMGSPSFGLKCATDSTAINGVVFISGKASGEFSLGEFASVLLPTRQAYYGSDTVAFNGVALFNSSLSPQTITNLYLIGAGFGFTGVPDPAAPGNILLTYSIGKLQQSTNVAGPFTIVPGAVSPYSISMTNAQCFYRVSD